MPRRQNRIFPHHGCPDGAVCIYPQNAGWAGDHPSNFYYSYGYHNLSNQYGIHRVLNWQYGGAKAKFCRGYGGTNCYSFVLTARSYVDVKLTPVNSIVLYP